MGNQTTFLKSDAKCQRIQSQCLPHNEWGKTKWWWDITNSAISMEKNNKRTTKSKSEKIGQHSSVLKQTNRRDWKPELWEVALATGALSTRQANGQSQVLQHSSSPAAAATLTTKGSMETALVCFVYPLHSTHFFHNLSFCSSFSESPSVVSAIWCHILPITAYNTLPRAINQISSLSTSSKSRYRRVIVLSRSAPTPLMQPTAYFYTLHRKILITLDLICIEIENIWWS